MSLKYEFQQVAGERFARRVGWVRGMSDFYRNNLDHYESYDGHDCWLAKADCAGFAVSPKKELVSVFSTQAGCGQAAMLFATARYSELHLNCFEGYLEEFYSQFGFVVAAREKNRNNVSVLVKDHPDVVIMKYAASIETQTTPTQPYIYLPETSIFSQQPSLGVQLKANTQQTTESDMHVLTLKNMLKVEP